MHRLGKFALLGLVLSTLAACVPPQGGGGAQEGGGAGGMLTTLLPLILIFAVFYFLIIRPQQKKHRTHREMLSQIRRGDQIVTGGGIIGNVVRVDRDDNLQVEIAPSVRVKVLRSSVQDVIHRPTPIAEDEEEEGEQEQEQEQEEGQEEGAPTVGDEGEKKS